MEGNTWKRFVLPALVFLIAVISLLILGGLASENPDGFEWAFFDFAGIQESEGGFGGILGFLGEGPLVDAVTGAIGIILVLIIALLLFRMTSRGTKA